MPGGQVFRWSGALRLSVLAICGRFVYSARVFEFFLYCEADGKCVLKEQGVETTREFSDILEAMNYLHAVNVGRSSKLTIYGPTGKVTFEDLI